jgi:hypothetical protein
MIKYGLWVISCPNIDTADRSISPYEYRSLIALIMDVIQTSETSVNSYQSTRRYNPDDGCLHICILLYVGDFWILWFHTIFFFLRPEGFRGRTTWEHSIEAPIKVEFCRCTTSCYHYWSSHIANCATFMSLESIVIERDGRQNICVQCYISAVDSGCLPTYRGNILSPSSRFRIIELCLCCALSLLLMRSDELQV